MGDSVDSKKKYKKPTIAVVVCNLGGPSGPDAIRPFLFNLLYDRCIINLPNPLRYLVAKLASTLRLSKARKIYANFPNSCSPILQETQKQAAALENVLMQMDVADFKVYTAMRHSKPFLLEVATEISKNPPDQIILLPMYPQFSVTVTTSVFDEWDRCMGLLKAKFAAAKTTVTKVCCFANEPGFVAAHAEAIADACKKIMIDRRMSLLPTVVFSAHGIPMSFIRGGDAYEWMLRDCIKLIMDKVNIDGLQSVLSYQSKVGKGRWLEPDTESILRQIALRHNNAVVVPIAFVTEHSETLVELDIDYKNIFKKLNPEGHYVRLSALGSNEVFIKGLASICARAAMDRGNKVVPALGCRVCPSSLIKCPCK